MNHRGLKAVVSELSTVIREFVSKETTAFAARLDAMDARFAALPVPTNGKDADPEQIKAMVAEAVEKAIEGAIAALPQPKDGKDAPAVTREQIVEALAPTADGMFSPLKAVVQEYFKTFPPAPGLDGKDGLGLASMLIDREGCLVATMTDGSTKSLGPVVGRDGAPGIHGKDGTSGEPGKDGRDGFGFDDLALDVREDGAFLRFMRGEEAKEFRLPIVLDRGVYSDGKQYLPGDGVTWAGSFWIAQSPTEGKPDSGKGWRLAVKRGRDGREVVKSEPGHVKVKVA